MDLRGVPAGILLGMNAATEVSRSPGGAYGFKQRGPKTASPFMAMGNEGFAFLTVEGAEKWKIRGSSAGPEVF
jgi:hypothetical protein